MKINAGIVVGEPSGDALAAPVVRKILEIAPDSTTFGIAGPKLLAEGCKSLYPMDRLSLMGFFEPLKRLPELYQIRRNLIQQFTKNPKVHQSPQVHQSPHAQQDHVQHIDQPIDVFIGVDAPDFNLGLERILREKNIPTVHYVSPTVWAWRRGRIHGIKKSVDLMLSLYPFEEEFYKQHGVPVCFTGHPFADQIPLEIDTIEAKKLLGYSEHQTIIAILPGSRNSELRYLAETYIKTAQWCQKLDPSLVFLAPLVSEEHRIQFESLCMKIAPETNIDVMEGNARLVMAACDVALATSGTVTLEIALHKKPMVVAYRVGPITYQIAKRLIKIPYISQPNLLAGERIVPEFIQDEATPEKLGKALFEWLAANNPAREKLQARLMEIHLKLRRNAAETAANAIVELVKQKK